MTYQILNKEARNAQFLQQQQVLGYLPEDNIYEEESIEPNKKFLLVCEGANTEKYYFEAFPVPSKTVEVRGGYGGGKLYLVSEAKKLAKEEKYQDHEVWCVFDFDVKLNNTHQKQDFDNAIAEAMRNDYKVAFSNDCFELWFLLHNKLIQNQHHRKEYFDMLTKLWSEYLEGRSYESGGKRVMCSEGTYKRLLSQQTSAIVFAKQLHNAMQDGRPYHQMNPCTTVYELVEELNKYIKK
jgi:hypothetical protein